jgi:antitoxin component YwqK of YwqJK toxin-antitoxin module
MEQPHGEFSYYYKSGQLESKGVFRDGVKYGLWERYTSNGNEKPEKIYASKQMLDALEE